MSLIHIKRSTVLQAARNAVELIERELQLKRQSALHKALQPNWRGHVRTQKLAEEYVRNTHPWGDVDFIGTQAADQRCLAKSLIRASEMTNQNDMLLDLDAVDLIHKYCDNNLRNAGVSI